MEPTLKYHTSFLHFALLVYILCLEKLMACIHFNGIKWSAFIALKILCPRLINYKIYNWNLPGTDSVWINKSLIQLCCLKIIYIPCCSNMVCFLQIRWLHLHKIIYEILILFYWPFSLSCIKMILHNYYITVIDHW